MARPAVAFQWMEVEGPLYDDSTTAGYRPSLRRSAPQAKSEVVSTDPEADEQRLMRAFLRRAYRRPTVDEADVKRFVSLVDSQRKAGLSFTEAMIAGYTAVLASPAFIYLEREARAASTTTLSPRASRSSSGTRSPTTNFAIAPPKAN